jgi:hypothetical protein
MRAIKEALRASAVPLPGKKILQREDPFVNTYSGKCMTKGSSHCFNSLAGKLRYFHKLSSLYTFPISLSSLYSKSNTRPQND